jgi:hypothetical protein
LPNSACRVFGITEFGLQILQPIEMGFSALIFAVCGIYIVEQVPGSHFVAAGFQLGFQRAACLQGCLLQRFIFTNGGLRCGQLGLGLLQFLLGAPLFGCPPREFINAQLPGIAEGFGFIVGAPQIGHHAIGLELGVMALLKFDLLALSLSGKLASLFQCGFEGFNQAAQLGNLCFNAAVFCMSLA